MAAPPRNIVALDGVAKNYGGETIFENVSLGLGAGDRIGVVGRNGGGKTTLLRLIARTEVPDTGRVTHATGLQIGLLAQADELDDSSTIRHQLVGDRPDHEWAGDARIRDVFTGLIGGVDLSRFPRGLDTPIGGLSGGERRRIALAYLLLHGPDLLLLDEPTNHLDVEGVDWLARHLASRKGTTVTITHDRWFLDAVCTSTWEISDRTVHQHDGGYAAWVLARAERERTAAVSDEKRRNLLRKELAWLRRGPPARTTKPQFRIDAANALIANEPELRSKPELIRFATTRLGKTVIEAEGVSFTVGTRRLLERLTWRIGPGDRFGLVGVNGSGKTTLLRILAGAIEPSDGRIVRGKTLRVGFLTQDLDDLDPTRRVLESLQDVRGRVTLDGRDYTAGGLCERFGFTGNSQWTFVGDLSGGERRRLQLMRLLMDEPNVILLDEPTNDLDTDTLAGLEDLLDGWPGSLVVVSHDRYFVERVCDSVYGLMGDGDIRHLPGGIEQYLDLRRASAETPPAAPSTAAAQTRGATYRLARKEADRLEREVARLQGRADAIHAEMAACATDFGRVATLDRELRRVNADRDALEESWLEIASTLE